MVSGGDRLAMVQAAVAATVSRDLGVPLARPTSEESIADQLSLTLVDGFLGVGQPVGDRLLGLERLMRWTEAAVPGTSSTTPGGEGMTDADVYLDGATARLHNQILNPVLPFQVIAPAFADRRTIDAIFGDAVRSALMAGSLDELTPEAQSHWDLLFDDGEPTDTLQRYQEYEQKVEDAVAQRAALAADATADQRLVLDGKIDQLRVLWLGLGKKREVEAAFRVVQSARAEAGFHDQRTQALDQLDSGAQDRSDLPGQTYHLSHLSSVAALFSTPGEDTRWRTVAVGRAAVIELLDEDVQRSLGLEADAVAVGTQDLSELRFEYLACNITRDWLDMDFLRAAYWRLTDGLPPLSDGLGGGTLPCLPTRVIFLRAVEYDVEGYAIADSDRPGKAKDAPVKHRLMFTEQPTATYVDTLQAARTIGLTSAASMLTKEIATHTAPSTLKLSVAQFSTLPERVRLAPMKAATATQPDSILMKLAVQEPIRVRMLNPVTVQDARLATTDKRIAERVRVSPVNISDHRRRTIQKELRKRPRRPRAPEPIPPVKISGTVTIAEKGVPLPELSVAYRVEPDGPSNTAVELVATSPHRATFELSLPSPQKADDTSAGTCTISLRLATGELLAESSIELGEDPDTHLVEWEVVPEPVGFVIADQVPLVHAYVIHGLPRIPHPDPDLHWA